MEVEQSSPRLECLNTFKREREREREKRDLRDFKLSYYLNMNGVII